MNACKSKEVVCEMKSESVMTENSVVILIVLSAFVVVAVTTVALVYNRGLSIKASESTVEVEARPNDHAPTIEAKSASQEGTIKR